MKPLELSKFLSYVLRHRPDAIGLAVDHQGWASIDELILKSAENGTNFTRDDFAQAVRTNSKKRFTVSEDGSRVRAAQGHSIPIDLMLDPSTPPTMLFHGTKKDNLPSIKRIGIHPQARHFVHLSLDVQTAVDVARRHGQPLVLEIKAAEMNQAGFKFFHSENGVWLTKLVPPEFLHIASFEN